MNRVLLALCILLTAAPFAMAHPIPKHNHDRTIVVHLTAGAVVIEYSLELDELTAVNDLPRSEWAGLNDRRQFYPVFLRYFAPVLGDNLVASLDGHPLTFTCVSRQFKLIDHLRCDYRFEAPWKLGPGKEYVFTIRESNYEMDSVSKVLLSVNGEGAVRVVKLSAPGAVLQAKSADNRGPGDDERLRKASATFLLESTGEPAAVKEGKLPTPEPPRAEPDAAQARAVLKPPPRETTPAHAAPRPLPIGNVEQPASVTEETTGQPGTPNKLLHLLMDSEKLGIVLALLFAAAIGAAHALTPGHGKTLVAAYLVGERGTMWHAVLLGLVTTATHTSAVLLLAIGLKWYFGDQVPSSVDSVIGLVGGFMVAGLGLWLLTRRLSGRADHIHLGGGHGHSHGHGDHAHGHDHGELTAGVGIGPLIWLGITGGIIPCMDAIVVLMWALKRGLVWLGPALILAFSAGLASVLIGIGIGVVLARRHIDARSSKSERLRRLVQVLPLLSAVAVTVLGLWMCYDSAHALK